jgi:hypothetical protein
MIALSQERIRRRHEATRNDGAAANSHEIDHHEHDRKNGEREEGVHDGTRGQDRV